MPPPRAPRKPRRKLAIYGLLLAALIAGAGLLTDPRFRNRHSSGKKPPVPTSGSSSTTPSSSPSAVGKTPPPPSYELFGPAGPRAGVSPELLPLAQLPAARAAELNDLVKSFWQQESARLQPRWTAAPSSAPGKKTLLAKADPSDAAFSLQALKARLQNTLGAAPAEALLPYLSGPMAFGGLGKYDLRVTLARPDSAPEVTAPGDTLRLSGDVTDPATGAVLFSFRDATPAAVQAWLGTSLDGQTPPP